MGARHLPGGRKMGQYGRAEGACGCAAHGGLRREDQGYIAIARSNPPRPERESIIPCTYFIHRAVDPSRRRKSTSPPHRWRCRRVEEVSTTNFTFTVPGGTIAPDPAVRLHGRVAGKRHDRVRRAANPRVEGVVGFAQCPRADPRLSCARGVPPPDLGSGAQHAEGKSLLRRARPRPFSMATSPTTTLIRGRRTRSKRASAWGA